ncbi:MAG: putative Zn-dependent hydrolase of beta-lactamase fold protein [Sphingobacteriales bacterium]|nr:putative Zn-dependent hydrolase of beta-lactamase fold protein [Sphingobacteriales bacterium]
MIPKIFGKKPAGKVLYKLKRSPNYKNGAFQNLSPTEVTLKSTSILKMMKDFATKPKSAAPPVTLPSVKTDLTALKAASPTIVWFGHSSYLIKYEEQTILVDPVFSGNASPVSFFGKSFAGSDVYTPEDFPEIDIIILTHDHYDHLDYKTILKFKSKTKHFYTPLGVGEHLKHWGVAESKITELDWWQKTPIEKGELIATPARHFSGRGITRNNSLWSSFVLKLADYSIYIGSDSGYDSHFKEIGNLYGPFDIAILETGQYNTNWPYIHMMPEQAVQAAIDLGASVILPVHWAKFSLALHNWNEPIQRVIKTASDLNVKVTTPLIGEPIILKSSYPDKVWWNL